MNASTDPKPKNAPWYVKAFVLIHLICITVWAIPNPPEPVLNGKVAPVGSDHILVANHKYLKPFPPLYAYLFTTGFWQYWDMFAPNPAQTDFYGTAEVIYKDGSKKPYQYPRIFLLPIPEKYPNERYRKYFERAHLEAHTYLWPQFALRVAYLMDDPKNPPVTVRLTRHWRPVTPPGTPEQANYNSYMYFEYAVDQRALEQMRKSL